MRVADLQAALNALGAKPTLTTDGILGKKTLRAVDEMLAAHRIANAREWSDERCFVAIEQLLYKSAGIEVGKIDGLVGPQTLYARVVYEARQRGDATAETWRDRETEPPPPPVSSAIWPRQAGAEAFFGKPGSNLVSVALPYTMRLAWDRSVSVRRFQCHAKVSGALERIFERTLAHYGHDGIAALRLDLFGGCFNIRKMRGGSALSMHSWGIAVDIDPERNQLKWNRAKATLDDPPYAEWWRIVESEGAVSLGRARDYDWMHFQFARL